MRPTNAGDEVVAVALLRQQVPEFEDHYRDLLDLYDEDLSAPIVFMELADFAADLLARPACEGALERLLEVLECVVLGSRAGRQLVCDAFLAQLSPLAAERAGPLFGPGCADLLARAEEGDPVQDHDGAPDGPTVLRP